MTPRSIRRAQQRRENKLARKAAALIAPDWPGSFDLPNCSHRARNAVTALPILSSTRRQPRQFSAQHRSQHYPRQSQILPQRCQNRAHQPHRPGFPATKPLNMSATCAAMKTNSPNRTARIPRNSLDPKPSRARQEAVAGLVSGATQIDTPKLSRY